tara:strand:- start:1321 stop:2286 length:966 start_codon:yes stop_codon:yes gene_type:complete
MRYSPGEAKEKLNSNRYNMVIPMYSFLDENNRFDVPTFQRSLDVLINSSPENRFPFIAGTCGGAHKLDIIDIYCNLESLHIDPAALKIIGVPGAKPANVIANIEMARDHADIVVIPFPGYGKPEEKYSVEEQVGFFKDIVKGTEVPIPMMMYIIDSIGSHGDPVAVKQIIDLDDRLFAMKCTGDDIEDEIRISAIVKSRDKIYLEGKEDHMARIAAEYGVYDFVCAVANVLPGLASQMYEAISTEAQDSGELTTLFNKAVKVMYGPDQRIFPAIVSFGVRAYDAKEVYYPGDTALDEKREREVWDFINENKRFLPDGVSID